MSTLTVTKTYAALDILYEADIDNFRTGLLTLFNTDKFTSGNFSGALALTAANFSSNELTTTDNSFISFGTDSDGKIGLDASGNLVFNTITASCTLTFKSVTKTLVFSTTKVDVPGEIVIGAGSSGYGVLHLLSKYRKPTIVYSSGTVITLENNTGTTNETLIAFPKYLIKSVEVISGSAKYRRASIAVTANGYAPSHTGAAQGGMKSGVTLTGDNWYAVYAARVRYGTNAGNNFIMVFDDTLPTQTNEATLDSTYGEGQWVYLGLVRYGYGVGTSTTIIPFKYTNKGWCYFTSNDAGASSGGLVLQRTTTDANDSPFFTIVNNMGSFGIPCDVIRTAQFSISRAKVSNWAIRDASDNVIWRGGWQNNDDTTSHGHLIQIHVEVGMDFTQTRIVNGAVDKRVVLAGFCDRMICVRRHGFGV